MNTEYILNWVQSRNAIIAIKHGPEILKEIDNDLYKKYKDQEGYWVEIALNDECAGWSYCPRLVDAIAQAFDSVCQFGIESGYLEKGTLNLVFYHEALVKTNQDHYMNDDILILN